MAGTGDRRCLVICSGGLDSTTAAAHAYYLDGRKPVLLYFKYGCHAEEREAEAVARVAEALHAPYVCCAIDWLRTIGGSTLTDRTQTIAGPVEGAEFPYEWVPARNLIFVANAAAYCDAHQIDEIYMGLNLEESAVYPDNTIEFYERLSVVLKFATLVRPVIRMPLARMMKWQIVKHAHEINAPIHLSWSCYRGGTMHCGHCGPCYMRQTAHAMLGLPDRVSYETTPKHGAGILPCGTCQA